jgi:hypothetical protein
LPLAGGVTHRPGLLMRLARSLVDLSEPSHRAALKAGYSWGTVAAAVAAASEPWAQRVTRQAEEDRAEARAARSARPVDSGMPDAQIRQVAQWRADLMFDRLVDRGEAGSVRDVLAWLNAQVVGLGARPFELRGELAEGRQLSGFLARAKCAMWWRRQLRRAVVRMRESEANAAGEVCTHRFQVYVTHETLARRRERLAASAEMMAGTELENEAGQVFSLAELSATSTSNKAIRRGELMTRIRGCEELAEVAGHRGVFLTLTAPSRFHAVLRAGGKNPNHDGSTPKDAHAWLAETWAKARARLQRAGVAFYGFRVAEPHHDGCPHWHALLWAAPAMVWRLVLNLRRWWLRDAGGEPGARKHRVKAVMMARGGASGYVAKYIAKGIDDAGAVGAEGHRDDDAPGVPDAAQADLFGGTAQRVEAWASAWGIRQFQAVGQPPVTVWRELRRVDDQGRKGCTGRLQRAFDAVDRKGVRRADWAAYVQAQGGLMRGREYLLRLAMHDPGRVTSYGEPAPARPWGVYDATGPGDVQPSSRQEWRPRGEWGSRQARPAPWTRVNNCTHPQSLRALLQANLTGGGQEKATYADYHRDFGRAEGPVRAGESGFCASERHQRACLDGRVLRVRCLRAGGGPGGDSGSCAG